MSRFISPRCRRIRRGQLPVAALLFAAEQIVRITAAVDSATNDTTPGPINASGKLIPIAPISVRFPLGNRGLVPSDPSQD